MFVANLCVRLFWSRCFFFAFSNFRACETQKLLDSHERCSRGHIIRCWYTNIFISKFYAKYHHKHTRKWQCIWYLCVRWAEKVIVLMLVYIVHAQVKPKNGFHSASKYVKLHSRKMIRNNNNNSGRSSSKCSQNKIKIIKNQSDHAKKRQIWKVQVRF